MKNLIANLLNRPQPSWNVDAPTRLIYTNTKALAETRIQEQSQVSEIRVVSPAAPPAYPTRPIRVYYVAGAVVAAMLVGVAAVLYAESVRPRLRSTADVERLGLPVLATIPRASWRVWSSVG